MTPDTKPPLQYLWLGQEIAYERGLEIQQEYLTQVHEGSLSNHFLALEHQSIYTIGRTRDKSSLGDNTSLLPHPLVEISRGGQATYHGAGQLTGYPIVDLRELGKDLHAYIRAIEQALILTCRQYGVNATRRDGMTGVWVENRKLASIGVGVRKWIAMHGFAINITKESLTGFLSITPCGLDGVTMTCLESEIKFAQINQSGDLEASITTAMTKDSVADFAEQCSTHLRDAIAELQVS